MLDWVDSHLRADATPGGGKLVWSSNWYPNRGRSYTHSTYEMAYGEELNLALTDYLVGRADEAYSILRATLCGIYNGPTPGGLSCHSYSDGRFPPSLPIILYGIVAGISVDKLFAAGLIPGILLIILLSIFSIYTGVRSGVKRQAFSIRELWRT